MDNTINEGGTHVSSPPRRRRSTFFERRDSVGENCELAIFIFIIGFDKHCFCRNNFTIVFFSVPQTFSDNINNVCDMDLENEKRNQELSE